MNNFRYIADSLYVVRTQAGFKRALKHFEPDYKKTEDEIKGMFPTSYPILVSFSWGYEGYDFIRIRSVHLNTIKEYIKEDDNAQ